MKITFLVPHIKISGGTKILLTYANLLAKRRHDVLVIASSKNKFRRFIANVLQIGGPKWIKNFKPRVIRVKDIKENNIPDADIIVVSSWRHALLINNFSENKGKKFYLIQHDERLYHGPKEEVAKSYQVSLNKIVVSTWLQEMIEDEFGARPNLLLNPIDKNLFYPIKVERKNDSIRILMLHHDYKWKGVKEGIEIFKRVKKKYSNLKLIMFGARKKEISLSCDEYYYKPAQEKLAQLYSGCDIFLCPSWDEGFGLPSVEAMACKCALVTYDNGGSRDYAFDRKTALVAKRRDINDLANKLELLVKNENLRKKIAENGYRFIHKIPTWEEQVEKLENIFEKSLNKNA